MPPDLPFSVSQIPLQPQDFPSLLRLVYQLALGISISCPLLAIPFNMASLSGPSSLKNALVGCEETFSDVCINQSRFPCLDLATIIRTQHHPPLPNHRLLNQQSSIPLSWVIKLAHDQWTPLLVRLGKAIDCYIFRWSHG